MQRALFGLAVLSVVLIGAPALADHHEGATPAPAAEAAPAAEVAPAAEAAPAAEPAAGASEPAADAMAAGGEGAPAEEAAERTKRPILFYIPNRLFDVVDFVRMRVRIGPGFSVGARVFVAEVFLGGYAGGFVGLPGPRQQPEVPWPLGAETYAGAKLIAGETSESRTGPNYSPTEVGASTQLGILGFSLGVDPWEVVDLLAGFVLLDPRGDDF